MSEQIDVGYRDPWDPCDDAIPDPPPSPDEYRDVRDRHVPAARPPIGELGQADLEQLLAFGAGVEQVLARDELGRRAGAGYQPSLLTAEQRVAEAMTRPRS